MTTTLARAPPRVKEKRRTVSRKAGLALQGCSVLLGLAGELLQGILVAECEPDAEPEQEARAHGQADEERGQLVA
jgi:hypothetical protein